MHKVITLVLSIFGALLIHSQLYTKSVDAACTITVTNTNDSGAGSFRSAVNQTNLASDLDTICFAIPGSGVKTIFLSSSVPGDPNIDIVNPVIIDGTSQPGYTEKPLIVLDGRNTGDYPGIWITGGGSGSTIKGIGVVNFQNNGIKIEGSNNTILGNYIGISADGTIAEPNGGGGGGGRGGIGITSSNNTVGDGTIAGRNIISGNSGNGIDIYGSGVSGNTIKGNYIGVDATGSSAVANTADGILVGLSPNNNIGGNNNTTPGGACTGDCNVISGNGYNGVGIWNENKNGPITSKENLVLGNFVGTNASGSIAVANFNIGVELYNSPDNSVGDGTPAGRNLLSGNGGAGLFITGQPSQNNKAAGNYIGTNTSGTFAVPNQKMGVGIGFSPGIEAAKNNVIGGVNNITLGGACTGDCNLISGNKENGVLISAFGDGQGGGNIIQGNYIGTKADGASALKNDLDGIGIVSAPNNKIGDENPNASSWTNARNIISGNGDNGIIIVGAGNTGNRIVGNYIGIATSGQPLPNSGNGVLLVGGIDTAITGNNISANGKLGIDLGQNHITLNDAGDSDSGPNRLQNFPNVFSAKNFSGSTKISGSFNGAPNTSFRFEFFSNTNCNAGKPNNFGEGEKYLGFKDHTTDQFGNVAFGFTSPSLVSGGQYITATATKKIVNIPAETSEFSQCVLVDVSKVALTNGATWFLKYDLTSGTADITFGYGFPSNFLMCAWDADQPGVKLPVIVSGNTWFMRASYTTGTADRVVQYGFPGGKPVCGDWNGDGIDTVGIVSDGSTWYLRNSNTSGAADISFQFGPSGSQPVSGDWNGDGIDTVGTVDQANNWTLRNSNSPGPAEIQFVYGFTPGYRVVGDWNGDGIDSIGSVSQGGTWNLRNQNSSGSASSSFQYGFPGAVPIIW